MSIGTRIVELSRLAVAAHLELERRAAAEGAVERRPVEPAADRGVELRPASRGAGGRA